MRVLLICSLCILSLNIYAKRTFTEVINKVPILIDQGCEVKLSHSYEEEQSRVVVSLKYKECAQVNTFQKQGILHKSINANTLKTAYKVQKKNKKFSNFLSYQVMKDTQGSLDDSQIEELVAASPAAKILWEQCQAAEQDLNIFLGKKEDLAANCL